MIKNVIFEWFPKENNLLGLSLSKVYTLKFEEDGQFNEASENIVKGLDNLKDIKKEDLSTGTVISLGIVIFKISVLIYD